MAFAIILLLASGLQVTMGQTVNTLPLVPKHTLTGATYTAFDSTYHSRDYTIVSGSSLNLDKVIENLVLPDEDSFVNLAETSLMGDASIDSGSDYSRTFINSTYTTAVASSASDVAVQAELSSAYSDTRMDAEVDFNTSSDETAYWRSSLAFDSNGDGDYEDSADKDYRTSLGKSGQIVYWNIMADWNVSDADSFMELTFSFKTTGASNYDLEIIHYTENGDSKWDNIDSSGEDKVTVLLYDTDAEHIAQMASIDDLLQMDLGDNPVINGLDYIEVRVGTDNAAATVNVRINNLCFFSDFPAITDRTDNDDDWDIDGSGLLWDGVWDDNDFLVTSITESTTETYDSSVPLYSKIESSPFAMPQDARKIQFTGNFYYLPIGEATSVSNDAGGYTTTEVWDYDTTNLDDLQTPANVISWGDTYYNMTLKESVLWNGYEDFEDDLVLFEFEETDKTEELRALWDSADDDSYKVAWDGTNPDATTGSSYDMIISYHSDESYSIVAGAAVAAVDNTILIIGIVIFGVAAAGAIYILLRGRKRK